MTSSLSFSASSCIKGRDDVLLPATDAHDSCDVSSIESTLCKILDAVVCNRFEKILDSEPVSNTEKRLLAEFLLRQLVAGFQTSNLLLLPWSGAVCDCFHLSFIRQYNFLLLL